MVSSTSFLPWEQESVVSRSDDSSLLQPGKGTPVGSPSSNGKSAAGSGAAGSAATQGPASAMAQQSGKASAGNAPATSPSGSIPVTSPSSPGGSAVTDQDSASGSGSRGADRPAEISADTTKDFIVFLDDAPGQDGVGARARAILGSLGINGEPTQVFTHLNGFVVTVTEQQSQRLRALGGIRSVEADAEMFLEPPIPGAFDNSSAPQTGSLSSASLISYGNGTASSGETLPWGVRAVWQGEDVSARGNFASDTYAFVIDSGVLSSTGDLNLATSSSWHRSWISGESAFTDGNGHGTHVAGTIAALANGAGVVGVAPGAQIVSLKVFDSSGGGASYASIIAAIDHAVGVVNNNSLDKNKVVINMSLGGGFSSSLDTATKNAANQGIRIAVAAGNSGDDVDKYSPAAAGDHANVFTISAVDSSYRMASWSNWDQITSTDPVDNVDFAAPGVSVLSYYRNGQLAYLSGTSMAAPHMAGLLLAGGVQAGAMVTPHFAGTADPFVLGILPGSLEPQPFPTYTLSSSSRVNEGETLTIDIATANLAAGTTLYWQISGNGISTSDFVGLSSLQGSTSINADGTANLSFVTSADATTEGDEVMKFALYSDPSRANMVGEISISITDTSTTPVVVDDLVLWGTTRNDVITGGSGNDRISGVLATGTTAAAMGAGQIDVLTGGPGRDVFVLGDSRGVFYDDRKNGNLGTSEYARITDFTPGEDKLQLRNGRYFFTASSGNLSVYWDRNNNGRFDSSGSNRDELIAILDGITSISGSDILWA